MASLLRSAVLRKARTLTLTRLSYSTRSHSTTPYHPTEADIESAALDVIQSNPSFKSVFEATDSVHEHHKAKHFPLAAKYQVMSRVVDTVQHYPGVNPLMVFIAKRMIKASPHDDNLTEDDVKSRVVALVKSYPHICLSKVTDEAHFCRDIGLSVDDCYLLFQALQLEFNLIISDDQFNSVLSCKRATHYIYNHLSERLPWEEFSKIYKNRKP